MSTAGDINEGWVPEGPFSTDRVLLLLPNRLVSGASLKGCESESLKKKSDLLNS